MTNQTQKDNTTMKASAFLLACACGALADLGSAGGPGTSTFHSPPIPHCVCTCGILYVFAEHLFPSLSLFRVCALV